VNTDREDARKEMNRVFWAVGLLMFVVFAVMAKHAFASQNNAKPLANDPLVAELKSYAGAELAYPLCTWPLPQRIVGNPELLKLWVDLTGCASVGQWATPETLARIKATKPRMVGLNLSPYIHAWTGHKPWTKAENCAHATTSKDLDYWYFVWDWLGRMKAGLDPDTPVTIMLDFEISHNAGPWPADCKWLDHATLKQRLNVIYQLCKAKFNGPVFYYNADQRVPGYGLSTDPRNSSPIPEGTLNDYSSISWYYHPWSKWNWDVLAFTAAATEKPIAMFLPFGGCFEQFPYAEKGVKRRSAGFRRKMTKGENWQVGYLAFNSFPRRNAAKFSDLDRVKTILWGWPEPLRIDDESMVWLLRGALEKRYPVQPP